MNPQVRTGLTHAGTAVGGMIAAIAFLSSHSVDIYALWAQINDVIAAILKIVALATSLATTAYAIFKDSPKGKLEDIAAKAAVDPQSVIDAAREIAPTPGVVAVADALKKQPA